MQRILFLPRNWKIEGKGETYLYEIRARRKNSRDNLRRISRLHLREIRFDNNVKRRMVKKNNTALLEEWRVKSFVIYLCY